MSKIWLNIYVYMYDDDNRKTLLKSTVSYLRQRKKKKKIPYTKIKTNIFNAKNPNEISWAKPNNSTERYPNARVIKTHTHTHAHRQTR
jgi:hypothetical protein